MSRNDLLRGRSIAVSISESPDMKVLGLADEHLADAISEVARHLVAMGARLIYGGNFSPKGYTELLIELAIRHRRHDQSERGVFTNYFPWPVHITLSAEEVKYRCEAVKGLAELLFLTIDGRVMPLSERLQLTPHEPTKEGWAQGLTSMRKVVTGVSDARVVLGGKVEGFYGKMPGVAEEALFALHARQSLFLLGGFGGCARDIADEIGITRVAGHQRQWPGRRAFTDFTVDDLHNGLSVEENIILATTSHIEQAVPLLLRGLRTVHGSRP
jgi:hypothetical protein